ncbi:hypothetical protein Cph01nite_22590 [Cellulomonas phragmiteti]|uniref:Uncharacterized protein n=1 Tax=Cellulomonas phragmiteti TaxID=478780 RepID=A0ABQ4DMB8_9CELL|nr:hypothetical protein Cph01nite_22590 [Cellulomonas phragmiteti]
MVDWDTRTVVRRILQSVQATDAVVVLNPEQLRGQIEAASPRASAGSAEDAVLREGGVVSLTMRGCRVPQMADVAPIRVLLAHARWPRPARRQVDQ